MGGLQRSFFLFNCVELFCSINIWGFSAAIGGPGGLVITAKPFFRCCSACCTSKRNDFPAPDLYLWRCIASTYQINHSTCSGPSLFEATLCKFSALKWEFLIFFLYQWWIVTGRKTPRHWYSAPRLAWYELYYCRCLPDTLYSPLPCQLGVLCPCQGCHSSHYKSKNRKMILKFTCVALDAAATVSQFVCSVLFFFSGKSNHMYVNTPDNFPLVFSHRCTSPTQPRLFSQIPPETLTTPLFQSVEFLPPISYSAQRRRAHFKGPACNMRRDLSAENGIEHIHIRLYKVAKNK